MKIDRSLNLVIPIEREVGCIYIHSMPIPRVVFEQYFMPISKAFASIYSKGIGVLGGPRIAYLLLKQSAEDLGVWDGQGRSELAEIERNGVKNGLINEIKRLTNVVAIGENGWETLQLDEALKKNLIDEEEEFEALNAIVFFTLNSAMHTRAILLGFLKMMNDSFGTQTTSSNCTEFARSLPTSTTQESSGEKAPQSSIPS